MKNIVNKEEDNDLHAINPIYPLFPVRASKVLTRVNYEEIIKKAWAEYDASKIIKEVVDISAMVSTNHVFRITFEDGDMVIAKLSYFGKYEHFKEDHRIIQALSNNLL